MLRRNFFIFQTRDENFDIVVSRCLYGADISRPEQRPLCNSKPGDLVFIWNIDKRSLYGPFEVASRLFYDEEEVGWTKKWPYRVLIRPWGSTIFEISSRTMPNFISFLADKMITIKDISDIIMGRRFLLSLIYEEGISLLRFLLAKGDVASELLKKVCSDRYKPKDPFLAKNALKNYGTPPEYLIELYLLQQLEELELLVGSGISEVYNTLYGYAGRFLDILTVHRAENGSILKISILELKKNPKEIGRGIEELAHYMFWASDKFPGVEKSRVFGMLITPLTQRTSEDEFKNLVEKYAEMYGLRVKNFSWVTYKLDGSSGKISFTRKS